MKALIFEAIGKAEDVLHLAEVPKPTAGAGQLLIRVQGSPINPSDIVFTEDNYGIKPRFPSSQAGLEGSGTVAQAGEGTTLPVGTRVSFLGLGTWAEYALVPETSVIPIPTSLTVAQAAQFTVNPVSAWGILQQAALPEGSWVLITGGNSAFAKLVIQLGTQQGLHIVPVVRSAEQVPHLTALGAAAVILASESVPGRVAQLTGKKGADCLIETIGGQAGASALTGLASGGKAILFGSMSGEPIPVNSGLVIFKNLLIESFWLQRWQRTTPPTVQRQVITELAEAISSGKLKLDEGKEFPLAEFRVAILHNNTAGRNGKVILVN